MTVPPEEILKEIAYNIEDLKSFLNFRLVSKTFNLVYLKIEKEKLKQFVKCICYEGIYHEYIGNYIHHGRVCTFRRDGDKRAEYLYFKGKRNGVTCHYNKAGGISEKISYKDGIIDGEYTKYYPNRKINFSCTYKKGKIEGDCVKYNMDGEIIVSCDSKRAVSA